MTDSFCQSAKLCMPPLITLSRRQQLRATPTRSIPPSATCSLRPALIHALQLLRLSLNLYSLPRASSWLSMRSYPFSTLHDLKSVSPSALVASSPRYFFADMSFFMPLSVLLVAKAPATNTCGIYTVLLIRTTSNRY